MSAIQSCPPCGAESERADKKGRAGDPARFEPVSLLAPNRQSEPHGAEMARMIINRHRPTRKSVRSALA